MNSTYEKDAGETPAIREMLAASIDSPIAITVVKAAAMSIYSIVPEACCLTHDEAMAVYLG
jgi:hypothetical protein